LKIRLIGGRFSVQLYIKSTQFTTDRRLDAEHEVRSLTTVITEHFKN